MVSRFGITAVIFLVMGGVIVGGLYANSWFSTEFDNVAELLPTATPVPEPTKITIPSPEPTEEVDPDVSPSTNPADPTATSSPQNEPTDSQSTPAPTATPTPVSTTNTPVPVNTANPTTTPASAPNQNVQVTATFLSYAICPSSTLSSSQGIVDAAEVEIAPIQAEYDACLAQVDDDAEACFNGCPSIFDTNCTEACGATADAAQTQCKNSYDSQRDPIVSNAIQGLESYCSIVVKKS